MICFLKWTIVETKAVDCDRQAFQYFHVQAALNDIQWERQPKDICDSSDSRPAKSEKFPTTGISRIEISPKRA